MAEKANKPLEGFDILADFLVGPKDGMKPDSDKNVQYQDIDPEDLQKQIGGVDEPADDKQDDNTKPNNDPIKDINTYSRYKSR